MKNNTLRSVLFIILLCVVLSSLPLYTSADGEIVFIKQPVGAELDNFSEYTLSWETTSADCQYIVQTSFDGVDFGNVSVITSTSYAVIEQKNFEEYYRIAAIGHDENYNDVYYYSDVIKITWRTAKDKTTAEIKPIDFGRVQLGYSAIDAVPVAVTNTGKYDIREPQLELGYGSDQLFEIIQNKEPHNIKPGETDDTTWSLRPRDGLGIGDYNENLYLAAKNFEDYINSGILFSVTDSGAELSYELSCDDIDLGTLEYGYSEQDAVDLVLHATGTGNLTSVYAEISEGDFFTFYANTGYIDLYAGTDSMTNWYVRLNSGLEPGDYEGTVKAWSNETPEPTVIKISARISVSGTDETDTETDNAAEDKTVTNSEITTENAVTEKENTSDNKKSNAAPVIIGIIAGVAVTAVAVIIVVTKKKKS